MKPDNTVIIYVLILLFIMLICYQIFLANSPIVEGATNYEPYKGDALILAQQNAGNISYLKQQVDGIPQMQSDIKQLQSQVNQLSQANQQYVSQSIHNSSANS